MCGVLTTGLPENVLICFLKMGGTYRRDKKVIKIAREIIKYECVELALYWKHIEERMNTLSLGKSLTRGEFEKLYLLFHLL